VERKEDRKASKTAEELSLLLGSPVYCEELLCFMLDVDKNTLGDLRRGKGFPCVRLTARHRVYMLDDVIAWLKKQSKVG
jgi:hypothetical protein